MIESGALNLLSGALQEIEDHSGHERGDRDDRDRSGWAEGAIAQITVIVTVVGGELEGMDNNSVQMNTSYYLGK